ncbi:MAG TPA: UpxY family transcription antiterminator [Puia sp.]|nr:UpxY family transcription antiterminator [Puia sp.]
MDSPDKSRNKWHVAIAKSSYYRKAAALLDRLNVRFYVPIQRQLHYWSDRKKWVDVPILSPYIFLFISESERKDLFQSCNFLHFMNRNGKLATVNEDEIEKVKLLCDHSSDLRLEQSGVKKGDSVMIVAGPLSGMNGHALQENGKHRFLIQIASLGQFASVEVDRTWLKLNQAQSC